MKIAISTDNGYVSAHFGRCPAYTVVEIEEGKIVRRSEIANPGHQPGFLPVYLSRMGVSAIIAGGMGPRAQDLFAEKSIQTITGVQGPVDEVIGKFIRQELEAGQDLCDQEHHAEDACRHGRPHAADGAGGSIEGKVCVSAKGPDLEAEIDPNFGRAAYFLIVDPKTLEFTAFPNPHAQAGHGAGVRSAQFAAEQSVAAVLTGQVGPNAHQVLESAGIRIIAVQAKGRVIEAISEMMGR